MKWNFLSRFGSPYFQGPFFSAASSIIANTMILYLVPAAFPPRLARCRQCGLPAQTVVDQTRLSFQPMFPVLFKRRGGHDAIRSVVVL
jgi:hypothetical protein